MSFWPTVTGGASPDATLRETLILRTGGRGHTMVRRGPWKLIDGLGSGGFSQPRRVEPGPGDPQGQLYNLANDIGRNQQPVPGTPRDRVRVDGNPRRGPRIDITALVVSLRRQQ